MSQNELIEFFFQDAYLQMCMKYNLGSSLIEAHYIIIIFVY